MMEINSDKDMKNPAGEITPEISPINEHLGDIVSEKRLLIYTSKSRAVRNLLVIGTSYFLFFSGFWSLSNLESTMNAAGGMGTDSQAIIYLCSMFSCFIPELMIDRFGSKTTFTIAILLSCPFIASNFHLSWETLIPVSVLYGLVSGPLNAAQTLYIDEMASRYTASSNEKRENVEAFFFGIYMIFSESTQILGNIIAYYSLGQANHQPPPNPNLPDVCGVHFRPSKGNDTNSNLNPPTDSERYILTGIYLAMGLMAVVVALFLDPLKNDVQEVKGCYSVWRKFLSAVRHLKNPHQLLLIPLSIFCGMEGSFYSAEYTEAFIACSWGVHHVGFVSICFGVCGALMAIMVGPLVKLISQMSVIILAAIINVVICSLLFVWEPSPDTPSIYFLFAGFWGMTDAIWWSQVAALYGLMFPNDREAAFSNFFFWSFLGYFLSYSYANYFTVAVKITIMLAILITGITLYVIGQIKIKCSARNTYVDITDSD